MGKSPDLDSLESTDRTGALVQVQPPESRDRPLAEASCAAAKLWASCCGGFCLASRLALSSLVRVEHEVPPVWAMVDGSDLHDIGFPPHIRVQGTVPVPIPIHHPLEKSARSIRFERPRYRRGRVSLR